MPGEWELIGRLAITLVLSAAGITTSRLSDEEVNVRLEVQGSGPLDPMVDDLRVLDGVLAVSAEAEDAE